MNLFTLYESLIRKRTEDVRPFDDPRTWPDSWKTVTSKVYERFRCISLPPPLSVTSSLGEVMKRRHSTRTFTGDVSLEQLSTLLFYGIGEEQNSKESQSRRMYPSAGRMYPLECYVLLLRSIGTIEPGVYHYDLKVHGLRNLRAPVPTHETLAKVTAEPCVKTAHGALFFTWTHDRSVPKYGERAYKLMLIELGCMTENIALVGEALSLGTLHVGTCATDFAEQLLDIDGYHESHVHTLFWGGVK